MNGYDCAGDELNNGVSPNVRAGFGQSLVRHGLRLERDPTHTLQINTGLLCNQACKHCHLEAGPARTEIMGRATMDQVADYAARGGFQTADVTGGAPEMVPGIDHLLTRLVGAVPRVMFRSNLTAIRDTAREHLGQLCRELKVVLVASLPATHASQTDAQRGGGVMDTSVGTLQWLNSLGYGQAGTGLELHLVSNPAGAFLPPGQDRAEERYRRDLQRKWGIVFNQLYTFANVPLGRFKTWLDSSGNYDPYMDRLAKAFNPAAVAGVMCRTMVSVDWNGELHDCDFHLAKGIPLSGVRWHVTELQGPPATGKSIPVADHCYACTAGAGFT
ncbi:MAG: radical SAM/Cys-rich domain protein [Desulfovibrionales bacterium]|nr:MAG: radical SAM/Cys-rich domain protein [Desulfovibrionales bacterium]